MKRTLLILLATLITTAVTAIPARRTPFTFTQPDGTVLTLQLVGDEHCHYYRNVANGQAMTFDSASGQYVALSTTSLSQRIQAGETRRNAANAARVKRLPMGQAVATQTGLPQRADQQPAARRAPGNFSTITGKKKGLVIIVNFKDRNIYNSDDFIDDYWNDIDVHHTRQTFDDMFNKEGYNVNDHIGSVHDYFYDQSYGQFDLTFDVVGPVTVSQRMSHYGGNGWNGNDKHPAEMVIEACQLADKQGVDFSKYDWNGDGYVDQVFVIYAGYGENFAGADPACIWPHEWELSSAYEYDDGTGPLKLDGVTVNTYACSAELLGMYEPGQAPVLSTIGTACHEFAHCLGYPDFYDTDYSGAFGMGAWDLMDLGSYNGPSGYGEIPSGFTSYERWMAGWLTPTELTAPATITDMKDLNTEGEAYVLYNPDNRNEYILFENRQPKRWFSYLESYHTGQGYMTAGNGLLAIHVDYDAASWYSNTPNDNPDRQRMTIIPAGKRFGYYDKEAQSWLVAGDIYTTMTFPGEDGVTSLTPTSHTQCGGKWFTGADLGHSLTEIRNDDGRISFLFDGGAPPSVGAVAHIIDALPSGRKTLKDLDNTVNTILQRQ